MRSLPPGLGKVNFRAVLEELPTSAARVLDLKPSFALEEIKMGINELHRIGF
jgi:hypothetical protein